jgi:uncharacterized protein (TIGR03437 family)
MVTSIVNAASGQFSIAPGSLVSIFGTGLSTQTVSASFAWPTVLGGSSVLVCQSPAQCVPAGLLYVSPTQINAYVATAVGTVAVTVSGVVSPPMPADSSAVAPGIFVEGPDVPFDPGWKAWSPCNSTFDNLSQPQPIRGAITDSSGLILQSSNPARPGRYYTIWLTGLGVASGAGVLDVHLESIPVYGYSGTTCEAVGPSFVGASPQYAGLNQVNFQMPTDLLASPSNYLNYPPLAPCGTYKMDLTLNVIVAVYSTSGSIQNYAIANPVQVPVLVLPGDVPCVN